MNRRALLAIGCNRYDYVSSLNGAEADAENIFETLMTPQIGDYDQTISRLLVSPSLQDVRDALTAILFGGDNLETFTITFAGHGAVNAGSFYMATRDSRLEALSATALSLADLLRMIAEAAPKQTYIFMDACQAGGLVADLNVILKSEVMGKVGTPGVTLLATAASNETAVELGGHGVGTTALLECIRGDTFLQDSNPALDLIEIGRSVSERVSAAGEQSPVVWGLNLYGPSSFCRNPHSETGNVPLRNLLVGWPNARTSEALRGALPSLWEPYVAVPKRWNNRTFVDRLVPLLEEVKDNSDLLINVATRVTEAFAAQASESNDRFREIEVRAACAVGMLPFIDDDIVSAHLSSVCIQIGELVEHAIGEVIDAVNRYQFALVTGGLGDLFYLPIRLSKLLGWAGYAVHVRHVHGRDTTVAAKRLTELYASLFDTYSLSLVAMSDSQAPYMMSALTASTVVDLNEEGERLLGHMFASSVDCGGRVARTDIPPSKVLGYLVARQSNQTQPNMETVAQPTELVLTLLRASRLFDLSDEFDLALDQLDHLSLNAYLPEDYSQFGADLILGGTNALFLVGHDIWRVSDIEAVWPDFPSPQSAGPSMTSLLASLLFPDRCPWFLLPRTAI